MTKTLRALALIGALGCSLPNLPPTQVTPQKVCPDAETTGLGVHIRHIDNPNGSLEIYRVCRPWQWYSNDNDARNHVNPVLVTPEELTRYVFTEKNGLMSVDDSIIRGNATVTFLENQWGGMQEMGVTLPWINNDSLRLTSKGATRKVNGRDSTFTDSSSVNAFWDIFGLYHQNIKDIVTHYNSPESPTNP